MSDQNSTNTQPTSQSTGQAQPAQPATQPVARPTANTSPMMEVKNGAVDTGKIQSKG